MNPTMPKKHSGRRRLPDADRRRQVALYLRGEDLALLDRLAVIHGGNRTTAVEWLLAGVGKGVV